MSAPRVSVIIRCLNEADHIGALFDGLRTQTVRDHEVVVVDSGSTDGTLELVRAQPGVKLQHIAKEDFSFGRSLNVGCEAADGEVLVMVSAHCRPTHDRWLEHLLEDFDDERVGVVYGRQRGVDSSHFSELRVFETWFPDESVRGQDGPFCNNANCAVRRSLWKEHRYDEELTGLEDMALAMQVQRDGWRVNYRADATVEHVHDESRAQTLNRYHREALAFQHMFPDEHFNLVDMARLFVTNAAADLRRAGREGVLRREARGVLEFRLMQFWGAYKGFHTRRPSSSQLKRRFYYPAD